MVQKPNQSQRPRAFGPDLYRPLDFSGCMGCLHDMPTKTLKWLPRFNGHNVITVNNHVEAIEKAFRDNEITHEDVWMNLLANSLDGNAISGFEVLEIT